MAFNIGMFSLAELTQSINLIPFKYGRLVNSGIFTLKPINTRTVMLERQHNILRLLTTKPLGAPGTPSEHGKRDSLSFKVPHMPLTDVILPNEYEGVRAFGTENQLDTQQSVMLRKLAENRLKFEITWEHMHWGAIKGLILDGDGSSVIYNLFDEFDLTQTVLDFELDDPNTDVAEKCRDLSRYIELNLEGDVTTGTRVFVSPEFFDSLITHASVKEWYRNWTAAAQMSQVDPRKGFTFGGVTFEECLGQATTSKGATTRYIAAGEGHAIPEGTMSTFETVAAPGNFTDTVNTYGEMLYALSKLRDFNQGVDIWMESNILPLCYRPKLLVKVKRY